MRPWSRHRTSPSPSWPPIARPATAPATGLSERGIQTTWYPAVHRFSGYQSDISLAHTEEFAERHFCLPLSPTLEDGDLDDIAAAVAEVAA